MVNAENVKMKLEILIDNANQTTGNADTTLTNAIASLISGYGSGSGGDGAKITEYVITENVDRSLWFNEQQIKLVKGLNFLITSKYNYADTATYNQGAVTFMILLWDGVSVPTQVNTDFLKQNSHLRGVGYAQGGWNLLGGIFHILSGNTTKYSIAEDGTLTFTTSATGVTTGNYTNSFLEGGYTYRLLQFGSDVVC